MNAGRGHDDGSAVLAAQRYLAWCLLDISRNINNDILLFNPIFRIHLFIQS